MVIPSSSHQFPIPFEAARAPEEVQAGEGAIWSYLYPFSHSMGSYMELLKVGGSVENVWKIWNHDVTLDVPLKIMLNICGSQGTDDEMCGIPWDSRIAHAGRVGIGGGEPRLATLVASRQPHWAEYAACWQSGCSMDQDIGYPSHWMIKTC